MRGDVLLYHTGGILKDRIVCAYTEGPFCHGEIDLGDGTCVGAHSQDGITCTREHLLERRVVISLQEMTDSERIEAGIAWVRDRDARKEIRAEPRSAVRPDPMYAGEVSRQSGQLT